ncbi:MAG: hypothetical protein JWQ09_707 [Segetibacter sp.]|nr:hypothetical protein [Segetibacter sp.]
MGYITVNQILKLLFGIKRFSLTNIVALPPVTLEYLHTINGVVEFSKKQTERVYGRRYSQIFRRNEYSPFLKLPEAPFSSAPTETFLNPLTVEKPGNKSILEAG